MFSSWYNWYFYEDAELKRAKEQIVFFKKKIDEIYSKKDLEQDEKLKRIERLRQVINSIEYTYSLY